MQFDILKRYNKKIIIFAVILGLIIFSVMSKGSKAKYRNTQVIPFVKGYITSKKGDLKIAAVWDGKLQSTFPPKDAGYVYDATNSSCTNGASVDFDSVNWEIMVKAKNPDNCIITFNYDLNFGVNYNNAVITDNNARPRIGKVDIVVTDNNTPNHALKAYSYKLDDNTAIESNNGIHTFENISWKGTHSVSVTAKDESNYEKTVPLQFHLDADAPTLSLSPLVSTKNASDNEWYKELTLQLKAEDFDNSIKEFKYCITTDTECTPDQVVVENIDNVDASRIVILDKVFDSNSGAQRVCVTAKDFFDNATENDKVCFTDTYKVDGIAPVIGSVDVSISGKNATVTVNNVVEEHSGVFSYTYQLDGSNITENGATASLTNLELGTHIIKVTVKDNAGNISETVVKDFTINKEEIKAFLLRKWGKTESTITARTDFSYTRIDGGNAVYKANDNDGTSYYLVGNPQNNWVKFANYYWRIVRINGDGSLRMIYQGTAANVSGDGTQLQTAAYNSKYNNNAYAGYMWTVGQQRGFDSSSNIKGIVDNFYSTKLSEYASYIDKNAGFCNDRSFVQISGLGGNGVGTSPTNFGARNRLERYRSPVLTCPSNDDLFTLTGATKGNGKLAFPIGLISADEVSMGGMVYRSSLDKRFVNMFDTGRRYWTMSPDAFWDGVSWLWYVREDGCLDNPERGSYGVRPVINLIKDITFSKGDGSSSSPFEF